MKILMVNTTFLPERIGGAELHTLWLAKEFQRMGHEVIVLCGGAQDRQSGPGISVVEREVEGVPIKELSWPADDSTGAWGIHEPLLKWSDDFLGKVAPDVVLFGLFWDFVAVAQAATKHGIPYAIILHLYSLFCYQGMLLRPDGKICDGIVNLAKCRGCVTSAWSVRHRINSFFAGKLPVRLRKKIQNKIPLSRYIRELDEVFTKGRAFAEGASLLIAPTAFVRSVLEKSGVDSSKIAVIPHGVAQQLVSYAEMNDASGVINCRDENSEVKEFNFTVMSRLSREKGIKTLISAFKGISHEKKAILNIFGTGPDNYVSGLKTLARTDHRIRFHGAITHSDVPEKISKADVIVVPSECHEISGLAAREALALGIPVIASSLGGLPEAVIHERNGLLFKPGDVEELRRTLERYIKGDAPRKPLPVEFRGTVTMAENARHIENALMNVVRGYSRREPYKKIS